MTKSDAIKELMSQVIEKAKLVMTMCESDPDNYQVSDVIMTDIPELLERAENVIIRNARMLVDHSGSGSE